MKTTISQQDPREETIMLMKTIMREVTAISNSRSIRKMCSTKTSKTYRMSNLKKLMIMIRMIRMRMRMTRRKMTFDLKNQISQKYLIGRKKARHLEYQNFLRAPNRKQLIRKNFKIICSLGTKVLILNQQDQVPTTAMMILKTTCPRIS